MASEPLRSKEKKEVPPEAESAPGRSQRVSEFWSSKEYPSASVIAGWAAAAAVLTLIILGMTPLTHNLDDAKVTLLHIGGGGLLAWFCWLWLRNEVALPDRWVMLFLAAWLGQMILSSVLHTLGLRPNANPYQWIGYIMIGQHLALLGIFLLHGTTMRTWRMVELTLLFWVLTTLGQCLFGMMHYSGFFKVVYRLLYFDQLPRGSFANLLYTFNSSQDMLGTILNRQFFGGLLVLWAPLCLAGVVIWRDLPRRLLSLVALVLAVPCMYLTFSKPVLPLFFASLGLTVLGLFVLTPYRRMRIPYLAPIVLGVGIVGATQLFFTFDQLADRFKTIGTSMHSRDIIWGGGFQIFKTYPLLGGGAGCFRVLFPEVRSPDYHLSEISNVTLWAHNLAVDLLAEQGLVGFLLYFLFLGATLRQAWRVVRTAKDDRLKVVAIALIAGIVGYFGTVLFQPGVRWVIGATPFWAALGLLAALGRVEAWHEETTAAPAARRRVVPRLGETQRLWRMVALGAAVLVWINPLPLSSPFFLSNFGYGIRYFQGARYNNKGIMLTQRQRPQEAIDAYVEGYTWNPTFITIYYKMAHAQNLGGDHEGALETYYRLMEYAPHYSEVHYNLGVIHRVLVDEKERAAVEESDPERRAALLEEAARHLESSRAEYAIAAKMSNKISIQYAYAQILHTAAQRAATPEQRREFTLQSARIYDRIPDLPLTTATQEVNQHEIERQIQDTSARLAARLYEEIAEHAAAALAYRRLFRAEPGSFQFMRKSVEMFEAAGDTTEAAGVLERTLSRSPLHFEARNLLADLLGRRRDTPSLREAYQQSQIIALLDREFPGQIPVHIQTANTQRLERLRAELATARPAS